MHSAYGHYSFFHLKGEVMSENKGYVHPEFLVDADWVEAHLHDPMVRLVEVDVDTTAYDQGHIPGAVGFNWQKELQDQVVRAPIMNFNKLRGIWYPERKTFSGGPDHGTSP